MGVLGTNDRWSFQELMPYFRMIETDTDFSGDFHGSDGPIIVRRWKPEDWNPAQQAFYEAARANGFPDCPDHNAPGSTGSGPDTAQQSRPRTVEHGDWLPRGCKGTFKSRNIGRLSSAPSAV